MSRPKGIPAWNKGMKEQAEIDEINLAYDLAEMVIDARIKKGLTQQELANLSGMLQPAIARIESGEGIPSLSSLQKIAKALGTKLIAPKFEMLVEEIDFSYLAETSIQKDIKEAAIPLYLRFFQLWSQYPELRYNINNGITLCHAHHPKKRAEEKQLMPLLKGLVALDRS